MSTLELYWKDLSGKTVTLYYSEDKSNSKDLSVKQLWAIDSDGTKLLLAEERE